MMKYFFILLLFGGLALRLELAVQEKKQQEIDFLEYRFDRLEKKLTKMQVFIDFKKENKDCILFAEVK